MSFLSPKCNSWRKWKTSIALFFYFLQPTILQASQRSQSLNQCIVTLSIYKVNSNIFLPLGPWHFVLIGDKRAPRMLSSWVACELGLHRQEKVRVSTAVGVGSCRQLEQHSTKQHNVSPLFSNPLISSLHLLVCVQCAQKMQLHRDWFVSVWYKKV